MKELISILRKKKPNFLRQNSNKYKFKNKWRAPRGLHNKIRLKRKGHVKQPSIGYGTPNEIKYIDKNTGLRPVLVSNISELAEINPKTESVILSTRFGMKKKVEIIKKCQELKLLIFNVKDSENELVEINTIISEKKKTKAKKTAEKKKKIEESKKVAEKAKTKKKDSESKTEEVKEAKEKLKKDVSEAKPKEIKKIEEKIEKNTTDAKSGHKQSSVPGTKQ
jgi:large subunit ribosomal protein L32e